jgi:predicted site-specific integrase-resolvase
VIITYDDRLSRFGTGLIEWWLRWWAVEVVRIGPVKVTQTLEQRLLEDLLALMTSFTGRFHRLRRSKKEQESTMPSSTAHCGS